jgi:hypothetical protein
VGLVNAAPRSAAILPLATAYNICEGLGFESGVNKSFSKAPAFYWLYTLLIVGGAGVVLVPRLPLLKFILFSQVDNRALKDVLSKTKIMMDRLAPIEAEPCSLAEEMGADEHLARLIVDRTLDTIRHSRTILAVESTGVNE